MRGKLSDGEEGIVMAEMYFTVTDRERCLEGAT